MALKQCRNMPVDISVWKQLTSNGWIYYFLKVKAKISNKYGLLKSLQIKVSPLKLKLENKNPFKKITKTSSLL